LRKKAASRAPARGAVLFFATGADTAWPAVAFFSPCSGTSPVGARLSDSDFQRWRHAMKKFTALLTGAAALALAACGDADDAADDTTIVETEVPAPAVTETAVVGVPAEGDDSVTVGEDGVEVDIDDGDTEIEADIDEDPSVTVRD
jgi:hypothetical protein